MYGSYFLHFYMSSFFISLCNSKWMFHFGGPNPDVVKNVRKFFGLKSKSTYILFSWQNEKSAEVFQLEKSRADRDENHLTNWAYKSKRIKIGEIKITDRSSYSSGGTPRALCGHGTGLMFLRVLRNLRKPKMPTGLSTGSTCLSWRSWKNSISSRHPRQTALR